MNKRLPEVRDTFVVSKNKIVHHVIVVTSVDHTDNTGTFKFFNSLAEAVDFTGNLELKEESENVLK